jgi:hypothetical protein
MRVEGGADNPANLDFTFPEIDEVGRHTHSGRALGGSKRRLGRGSAVCNGN